MFYILIYSKLMAKSDNSPEIVMEPCILLNISQCNASEQSDTFVVTVYNPLARSTSRFIRVPVPPQYYKVLDPQGTIINFIKKYTYINKVF